MIKIELALDAETTATAQALIQRSIDDKQNQKAQLRDEVEKQKAWRAFFLTVSRHIQAEQSKAVENFANQYGPRTSTIQRRLRPVYGFDDIEIRNDRDSILVSVNRAGEALSPVDYFSQSQQQTLLLGLFLTACSSQNWSAFSPVFLDDPFAHFDDLNMYALLDLIAGLFQTEAGNKQFIISTCDEKLFKLALQKFRRLGDGAKYYRFEAIGGDGPRVSPVNAMAS